MEAGLFGVYPHLWGSVHYKALQRGSIKLVKELQREESALAGLKQLNQCLGAGNGVLI